MKWGLKGGISIDADSEPPRYVLWCCSVICHQLLTFFQIGCGQTVGRVSWKLTAQCFLYSIQISAPNLSNAISLAKLSINELGIWNSRYQSLVNHLNSWVCRAQEKFTAQFIIIIMCLHMLDNNWKTYTVLNIEQECTDKKNA